MDKIIVALTVPATLAQRISHGCPYHTRRHHDLKGPVRIEITMVIRKTKRRGSNKSTIGKMFNAERKELTDEFSPANEI